ncbi:Hsp70 family protein, partial [Actinoalloteichus caeruleus]
MRVLSVDLGTSNTVAVLSAHGREPRVVELDGSATMPSAVYADEDGALVVGRDAERRARLDPARFEPNPKRRVDEGTLLLGTTVVTVTDALAAVLRRVAEEASRQLGGEELDEVRLTHPARWGTNRRTVLLSAARLAGFTCRLVLVPEPVAAAAHFTSFPGRSLAPGQALAVYDLGAGTFDCAVVAATEDGFVVLAENGLPNLGGLDVDQVLLDHVGSQVSHQEPARWQRLLRPGTTSDRRAQRMLREDVRAAKEALSRHSQTEVPLPEPFPDVL